MTEQEASEAILAAVRVTPADVTAAKGHILHRLVPGELLDVQSELPEWAAVASPGAPNPLRIQAEDVGEQLVKVAASISAQMALGAAAWRLVQAGLCFHVGEGVRHQLGWTCTTGRHSGSLNCRFVVLFPRHICRPDWLDVPSDLFDADLYLQHFDGALNANVSEALRMSLACFRGGLHVPCVAMLGAASEGAWIELGHALSRAASTVPAASKLGSSLNDPNISTKAKITQVCNVYDRPECKGFYTTSGVSNGRLRTIQQWSDQVREARNVLHWGAVPSVPNTYEKVAVLLMDAVSEINDLHRVKSALQRVP